MRKPVKSRVLQDIFQCHKEKLPRTNILGLRQLYFFSERETPYQGTIELIKELQHLVAEVL